VERGLFIAASGMLAAQIRQDVIANNLANATNNGFRADVISQQAFGDLLLSNTRTGAQIGPLSEGSRVAVIRPDLQNGGLEWTKNPLDLAVVGDGWFSVRTANGVAYTRNGAFTTNAQGAIVDASGSPVLSTTGQPITVNANQPIGIDQHGRVTQKGTLLGQIAVTALTPASVNKLGTNYYSGTPNPGGKVGGVAQGALESSNVNSVSEMVNLIDNMRVFQADQKVVNGLDDELNVAANQIGKV
jgi:flagellar basal-body rod protein FlgF